MLGMWSKGCYYSTVGHVSEDIIIKYIEAQKEQN
jgi:REP element-mobilizing transposase RayT